MRTFFNEYRHVVIFHLRLHNVIPEERFRWYRKKAMKLAEVERKVFLAGFEKAYALLFGGCYLCTECQVERLLCKLPEKARPAPEGMAVDVFYTVKRVGYPISVRTDTSQAADRYVLLMVD
jgi:predicted metal-binding protein